MGIKGIILPFLLIVAFAARAQQVPYFHQYQINPMVYNPAASGASENIQTFFIRNQKYLGFEGGNISNLLTVNGRLFSEKMGFGLTLYNDNIGLLSSVGGSLAYSYKIDFSEKANLAFGVALGASDKRFNFSSVIVQDFNDPVLDLGNAARKTVFDLNAGLLLNVGDFQFGVSVPQAIGGKVKFGNDAQFRDERHFIAMTSYRFLLSEKLEMSLSPIVQAKYVPGAPFHFDGGVYFNMEKFGWAMVTYNSGYGISGNLGVRIKKSLMIGYAYDIVLNVTSSYKPFNQELLVGYRFGKTRDRKAEKALEKALVQNDSLRQELLRKDAALDSLQKEKAAEEEKLRNEMLEKQRQYEDSIRAMKASQDSLKQVQEKLESQVKKAGPVEYEDDGSIRKSKDDHFLELDMTTESPKGYYVIVGAWSKIESAESQLEQLKAEFPDGRLIFNERNRLNYVLLKYSEEKSEVFQIRRKARAAGMSKAWILSY